MYRLGSVGLKRLRFAYVRTWRSAIQVSLGQHWCSSLRLLALELMLGIGNLPVTFRGICITLGMVKGVEVRWEQRQGRSECKNKTGGLPKGRGLRSFTRGQYSSKVTAFSEH